MKLEDNGILIVNKEKGYTSRDVVNIISKLFGPKKAGHNGTLDPLATGVLVICLNRYTKLNNILAADEKEYIAEVTLGIKTDTLDIDGKIIEEKEEMIDKSSLLAAFKRFETTYEQEVPLYSAVKVNGKKLYEYARSCEDVLLPRKKVTIKKIELLDFKDNKFSFKCTVSKGTYIRSLIRDILDDLGVTGTMSNLIRTRQGIFDIKEAYSLDDIRSGHYKLLKVKDVLNIDKVTVSLELKAKILNGNKFKGNYSDRVLCLDENGEELAIYKRDNDDMRVEVML